MVVPSVKLIGSRFGEIDIGIFIGYEALRRCHDINHQSGAYVAIYDFSVVVSIYQALDIFRRHKIAEKEAIVYPDEIQCRQVYVEFPLEVEIQIIYITCPLVKQINLVGTSANGYWHNILPSTMSDRTDVSMHLSGHAVEARKALIVIQHIYILWIDAQVLDLGQYASVLGLQR